MSEHSMRLQSQQRFEDQSVVYEVKVSRALMEDMRDLRKFVGLFNVRSLTFHHPEDGLRIGDWVELQQEGLAMQLLRLAYIAARHEEGPYGEPE